MCCSSSCCILMLVMVLLLQVELWVRLYFAGFVLCYCSMWQVPFAVWCQFLLGFVKGFESSLTFSCWLVWTQVCVCCLCSLYCILINEVFSFIKKKKKKWQNAFLFPQMILLLISTFTDVGSMLFLGTNSYMFKNLSRITYLGNFINKNSKLITETMKTSIVS